MHKLIEGDTIDEIMYQVFNQLMDNGKKLESSSGNGLIEIIGKSICLKNPRARLSRSESRGNSISTIGEFLWHMSGKDDSKFISHYIPKYSCFDKHLIGAYGSRLFNLNNKYDQVNFIINLCKKNPNTKNAVIQLFNFDELVNNLRGTCTLNLHFLIRNRKLTLITTMRSNDAYLGLPHDIYSFTMLQELVASELGYDVGEYFHNVGSLHLYSDKIASAENYIAEGLQATSSMPAMPKGDSIKRIKWLLEIEKGIREGTIKKIDESWNVENYWKDLVRLLLVNIFIKNRQSDKCMQIYDNLHDQFYKPYVMDVINRL